MKYVSTRNKQLCVDSAQAIVSGLAPDGGLFLPTEIPSITLDDLTALAGRPYAERAAWVLSRFLTDFSYDELLDYTAKAYSRAKFPVDGTAPLVKIDDSCYVLELFHGPTCAFKDFALQILPYLLTASLKKTGVDKEVVILVATSGDTGKAALEGFADVPGTRICVFFPDGGTSNMQRLQMVTQEGKNVMVAAVKGNFDDAQNGVKAIFTDRAYGAELEQKGFLLSSANSINWGRLAPQIAYYVSAYCDMVNAGAIAMGEPINICVPTGNFGNILAAYYAKHCGVPVNKLICASNRNSVLTDFINGGTYDKNRPFYVTSSPSMDILISSNLERLLYLLCDEDDTRLRDLMDQLKQAGRYSIEPEMLAALQAEFAAGCCSEGETRRTIRLMAENKGHCGGKGYLPDTHTAVGLRVYYNYRFQECDITPTVVASTASPFKFCGSVLPALGEEVTGDDFAMLEKLSRLTGLPVPERLAQLKDKQERFTAVVEKTEMKNVVNELTARRIEG
ncbi:MAG: threonine synthase [Firmicutes bacterium]|nr:threonine synthase [Bacillota bacterium]